MRKKSRKLRINKDRVISIGKTKILTPLEVENISKIIKKLHARILFKYLVATGFRFTEFPYILTNLETYDVAARTIHFSPKPKWDATFARKPRDIYLSYRDMEVVNSFIRQWHTKRRKQMVLWQVSAESLSHYIKYWLSVRGVDSRGYGTQSLRKSRFLWLAVTYPNKLDVIMRSLDYNPFYRKTDGRTVEAYIESPPFTEYELQTIKERLIGWKGSETNSDID
jgi:hypothetical protein